MARQLFDYFNKDMKKGINEKKEPRLVSAQKS